MSLLGTEPSIFLLLICLFVSAGVLWEISLFSMFYRWITRGGEYVGNYTAEKIQEKLFSEKEEEKVQEKGKQSKRKEKEEKEEERNEEVSLLRQKIQDIEKERLKAEKQKIAEERIEARNIPIQMKLSDQTTVSKTHEEEPKNAPSFQELFGKSQWEMPPTNLLREIKDQKNDDYRLIERRKYEIQETLQNFRVDVEMSDYVVGPTVVQYRLTPAEGVKLQRIEALKKDLTLALKAKSIRIQAPIPGLGLVGLEVPNDQRSIVGLRELLESKEFQRHPSNLSIAVGKDI